MVRKGKALADPADCEYPHGLGGGAMYTLPKFIVGSFGLDSILTEDSILDP
jgi:hypothetical protein